MSTQVFSPISKDLSITTSSWLSTLPLHLCVPWYWPQAPASPLGLWPCEAPWISCTLSVGCEKSKTFLYLCTSCIYRYFVAWWHAIKWGMSKKSSIPDVLGFSLNVSGASTDQVIARRFQNTRPSQPGYSKCLWPPCPYGFLVFILSKGLFDFLPSLSRPKCKVKLFCLIAALYSSWYI